jgi:hypothetical protein
MKKILLLAAVTISIISCSKSDSSESSTDKIVGKWVVTSATIQIGANGTPTNSLEACQTLGNVTFTSTTTSTGNSIDTYYYPNATTSACEIQPVEYSTWTNIGNNTYNITYSGQTGVEVINITFSNSDRTMLVTFYDGGNYILKTTYSKQ